MMQTPRPGQWLCQLLDKDITRAIPNSRAAAELHGAVSHFIRKLLWNT